MKNRNLLLLVALLLTIFAVPSCDFVNVDSPEVGDSTFKPVYRIQGTVLTENSAAIEGAKVFVGDKLITTNAEGKFELTTENPYPSGTDIHVAANGYIESTVTLQYTDKAPADYDIDFTLSRALPAGFVDLTTGGELVFEDITLTIPGENTATFNGQTLTTVQLSVSPLSPISTYGSFSGNNIKTLIFNPVGMVFEKPITVTVKIPAGFNADNMVLSLYNEATNTWENSAITVTYNSLSSEASFQLKVTSSGKLNNPEELVVFTINDLEDANLITYSLSTCDCEDPFSFGGGTYLKNYQLVTDSGPAASYRELYDLGFFGLPNVGIGWNKKYIPGYNASVGYNNWWPGTNDNPNWLGLPILSVFTNLYLPVFVDNCESKQIVYQRKYKMVTGKYVYNNQTTKFTLRWYYSITTPVITDVPCTVHNGCHQGCGTE